MSRYITTEYKEPTKVSQQQNWGMDHQPAVTNFVEESIPYEDGSLDVDYQEDPLDVDLAFDVVRPGGYADAVDRSKDSESYQKDDGVTGGHSNKASDYKLPGAAVVNYVEDDEEEVEEETDWLNHRDPKHFMTYIMESYPHKIPQHDGTSTLGCERAINFLLKLNKEISEALRGDSEGCLDEHIGQLEDIRVNLNNDVMSLKDHVKKLNKKTKKADDETVGMVKVATTPGIQLVMTPFERAITGIIINASVSAGKPLEDVYQFLKKKYSLDEREELAIMQLLRDMGQPIFGDRGVYGKKEEKGEKAQGVDFIKNYFA